MLCPSTPSSASALVAPDLFILLFFAVQSGITALHSAVLGSSVTLVHWLVGQGADINATNKVRHTHMTQTHVHTDTCTHRHMYTQLQVQAEHNIVSER